MKTRFWLFIFTLTLLVACEVSNNSPTPTIVPLNRSATPQSQVDTVPPTATRLPYPSPTPTRTPMMISDLSLSLLTPSTPPPTFTPRPAQAEVIATSLNIRQGPGVDYPSIGVALAGETFDVVGTAPDSHWLQIITPAGETGWISGKSTYTRITGPLGDVPAGQVSPPPSGSVSPASPAGSAGGLKGKLVFMTGSGGDLYLIKVDGTGLRRLASGVIDPVVSPDGSQVAFTRWDGAELGTLFTLNLDGGGERAILGETLQAKSPTWSPDGQEIIVSFQHGGLRNPQPTCREFDFDDGINLPKNIRILKTRFDPTTGILTICFIRLEDLQWQLRRVNLATGQFADLPVDLYSYNPAWDPQNPWRVVYDGSKGLMQLDLTSGEQWPLTADLRDTGPVFSPDGQTLALTYKQHDHWEVYTLDLATGARQRLTKPPLLADPQYSSASPTWSPDGQYLAFVTNRTGQWEMWVMNADGSNQHPLFSPEVQASLGLAYWGMNERMLNWVE